MIALFITKELLLDIPIVITAILAIITLFKKVLIPFYKFCKKVNQSVNEVLDNKETIKLIAKELKPNGGESIKDKINKIDKTLHINTMIIRSVLDEEEYCHFETDWLGNCTYVNRYWSKLTGISKQQALGTGWTHALHVEDRERIYNEFIFAVKNKSHFESIYRYQNFDTNEIYKVRGYADPVILADGSVASYIGRVEILEKEQLYVR